MAGRRQAGILRMADDPGRSRGGPFLDQAVGRPADVRVLLTSADAARTLSSVSFHEDLPYGFDCGARHVARHGVTALFHDDLFAAP